MADSRVKLRRSLTLPMITCYGLGTIIGGGFYALAGKVSGECGMLAPLAFGAAAAVAVFTAFSYAELSARYPVSAGEAHYVLRAFGRPWAAAVVGWTVIATGVVSAATLADAFAGFARELLGWPPTVVVLLMVTSLGLVAAWGIGESARLAVAVTVLEVAGLVLVAAWSAPHLLQLPQRGLELLPRADLRDAMLLAGGAHLAFYSFVGFEDMVNVAEEVKSPRRNLPIAILASLAITSVLYLLITTSLVLAVDQRRLAESDSPLSLVFPAGGALSRGMTVVGLLSGLNGALVQIIMGARVMYGMARQGQAPGFLARVHRITRTPLAATLVITAIVLLLALGLPIVALAKITSSFLLAVYGAVNLALLAIKARRVPAPASAPSYHWALPAAGLLTSVGLLMTGWLAA